MDQTTQRSCLLNALMVAGSDGSFDPVEQRLVQEFMRHAGIDDGTARRWHAEHVAAGGGFLPVADLAAARDVLKLTIGVAGADARLDPGEWAMLALLAKALEVPVGELRALVQAAWGRDVIADLFAPPAPAAPPVLLVTDHFDRLDAFLEASPGIRFERRTLVQLPASGVGASWVVFHAAEDREETQRIQAALGRAAPAARTVAIVGRHQGYQVSYLLASGTYRCLVEALYPNELARVLAEERGSSAR